MLLLFLNFCHNYVLSGKAITTVDAIFILQFVPDNNVLKWVSNYYYLRDYVSKNE